MELESEGSGIVLRNVFVPVKFKTQENETITVAMRDDGFEIMYKNKLIELKGKGSGKVTITIV